MRATIRGWLLVWAGWTGLALFFAASTSLTYRSTGRPANWAFTIERALSEWWLWALLTPLVVWLATRYPLDRPPRARHALVLLAAGAAITLVKAAIDRAVFALLTGFWMYWLYTTLALQFFVYGAIVIATHGVAFYRRSRERDHLEARLAEARLQLLGLQLQPHFLFNTLNTIAELVYDKPEAADRMITGLSDLLRRALDLGSRQHISLRAEIDLLACYLDIQKARFGERLRPRIDVSEDAAAAGVPAMLLQPIVENAIRHGLAAHLASGRIEIDARRDGSRLVITVEDDGPGTLGSVQEGRGFGLANTRARLEALYGGDHRLTLTTPPDRGARVTIDIPFREAGEAEYTQG